MLHDILDYIYKSSRSFRDELTVTCRGGCCVTCKTGFGFDDWIYCTSYTHNSGLQDLHTLKFTVTHTHTHTQTRILSLL
jgi:hypothetical protein